MGPSNFFVAFLMMLLTVSGGTPGSANRRNDLLDLIPTAAYWRAKSITPSREQLEGDIGTVKAAADIPKLVKDLESLSRREAAKKQLAEVGAPALDSLRAEMQSDDPEAAAMAKELVESISQRGKAGDVRRLMAIRTLGERKEKDSLPLLKTLQNSKELFVADYAARAIAQISGTPLPASPAVDLSADLKLLPATAGIVGQTTGIGIPGFTLETFATQMLGIKPPNGEVVLNPADKDKTIDNLTSELINIAEATGNVRVDGATMAVSGDIGGSNNWFTFVFRGEYDREAVAAYTAKLGRNNPPLIRDGDMMKLQIDRDSMVLFPSSNRFIVAAADPSNTPLTTIIDPMIEFLRNGTANSLPDNKPLADVLKTVDQSGPLWIACIPSARMRSTAPVFAAFDSLALSVKQDKDQLKVTATGRGTGDIAAAVQQFNSFKDMFVPRLKALPDISKDFQPLVDAIDTLKLTSDEKSATATATASPEILKSILGAIIGEFRLTTGLRAPAAAAPAVVAPVVRDGP